MSAAEIKNKAQTAAEETDTKNFSFAGWTPCLAGELNFDFVSCGLSSEAGEVNINTKLGRPYDENRERVVFLHSQYNWKDRVDDTFDGKFHVFLTATSTDDNFLEGKVYIARSKFAEQAWAHIDKQIDTLKKAHSEHCNSPGGVKETEKQATLVKKEWLIANNQLRNSNESLFYQVAFKLEGDGLTHLSCTSKASDHDMWLLCRQAFYYIKYATHQHKHHPDSIDSLTTVHPISDDNEHIRNILSDLKNGIIEIKRDQVTRGFVFGHQADGVATYTKSLLTSLKQKQLISTEDYEKENIYFSNVIASTISIEQHDSKKHQIKSSAGNVARQIIMLLVGFLGPILIAYSISIRAVEPAAYAEDAAEVIQNSSFLGNALLVMFSSDFFMFYIFVVIICIYCFIYIMNTKTIWYENTKKKAMSIRSQLLLAIQTHIDNVLHDIFYKKRNGYLRFGAFFALALLFLFISVYFAINLNEVSDAVTASIIDFQDLVILAFKAISSEAAPAIIHN